MRSVGRMSYAWYLWHWPVLLLAPALFGQALGLAGRLAMVVVSFGLEVLTLHLIENPARFAPALKRSAAGSHALGAGVTAVTVCAGLVLLNLRPVPVGDGLAAAPLTVTTPEDVSVPPQAWSVQEQLQAAVAASADLRAVPSNLAPRWPRRPPPNPRCSSTAACGRGATSANPSARREIRHRRRPWRWSGIRMRRCGIRRWNRLTQQRHWRLETMSKVLCPLQDLPIHSPYLGRTYTECEQWRGEILSTAGEGAAAADRAGHGPAVWRRFRVYHLRPGVAGQADPVGGPAARYRCKRVGSRTGSGSALDGAVMSVGPYGQCDGMLATSVRRGE